MQNSVTRIGRLLSESFASWRTAAYAEMASHGFTDVRPAHSPVFRYCAAEPQRTSDLARMAGMTKQSMSGLVATLKDAGYVELQPDPSDRRAQLVSLSPKGQRASQTLAEISTMLEQRLAAQIGDEALENLRNQLSVIAANQAASEN